MPSIYDIKPTFQKMLRPLSLTLLKMGATPNKITIFALIGSVLAGFSAYLAKDDLDWLLVIPIWLFIRMALNALDGMIAREFNLKSHIGAVLNEIGDVISDVAIYLPLAYLAQSLVFPIVLFCIGTVMTEFCGLLGQAIGGRRHYEGPMGKSDRAFLVGFISFITALFPPTLSYWPWVMVIGFILTILTCINRIVATLKESTP